MESMEDTADKSSDAIQEEIGIFSNFIYITYLISKFF